MDYQAVGLVDATGATILSPGSNTGSFVRLVDEFSLVSSGIPSGGNYSFSVTAGVTPTPPTGSESLLIQAVNINGLQCSQITPPAGEQMTYQGCTSALSFFSAFTGGSAAASSAVAGTSACKASFCCGFVVKDVASNLNFSSTPQISPAPEAEIVLPPTGNSTSLGTLVTFQPTGPAPELEHVPLPTTNSTAPPMLPVPLKSDGVTAVNNTGGNNNSSNATSSTAAGAPSSDSGILIGVVVAAVLLLIAGIVTTVWVIRRRRHEAIRIRDSMPGGAKAELPAGAAHSLQARASSTWARRGSLSGSFLGAAVRPGSQGTLTIHQAMSPASSEESGRSTKDGSNNSRSTTGRRPKTPSASDRHATPSKDDQIQEVTLFEQLGSGAFGTVYRGEWAGSAVAVKVLQTACASSSKELDSFRQEVAVLSRLRHPNIIAFLAACTVPPDICIIEELAEGGSLHAALHGNRGERRHTPFTLRRLLSVAADVAEAMVYLHPRIVHRDLKSQNVLLNGAGQAKVCDFGIAKFKDRTFVSTMNGQAGTPAYMAPELFDGGQVTEKVDVYSFAILLWEMLTGDVPWGGVPSPMQIIYYVGVLQQRPRMPQSCPTALRELIEACWAESPDTRPTFREILGRLRDMMAEAETNGTCNWVLDASDRGASSEDGSQRGQMDGNPPLTTTTSVHGGEEQEAIRARGGHASSWSSFGTHALHSFVSEATATTTTTGVGTDRVGSSSGGGGGSAS